MNLVVKSVSDDVVLAEREQIDVLKRLQAAIVSDVTISKDALRAAGWLLGRLGTLSPRRHHLRHRQGLPEPACARQERGS